ncbi:MAG: hypothetical protein V4663_18675 [Bacteroidota bacterium]
MLNISNHWTFLEKLIFRFAFIVLGLFMLFFNNGTLPPLFFYFKLQNNLLQQFIPWLGKNVFHLPYNITVFTNGSGDTTYDYLVLFCCFFISIIGTIVWTAIDRKSINYHRLYYWLTVGVRFYVGFMLINYGAVKVIQLQFPAPNFSRLMSTYGESSPMGLAWTFLGFSKGYNLFMGIAELAAGFLLFRRTVTIGAIITLMTTANVMAVNYFYDVPVKIVSTALVVMCLYLLAPNFKNLFKLFFKGEPTILRTILPQEINKRWLRITKYSIKYLLIGYTLVGNIIQVNAYKKEYGPDVPKSPLYGAYKVDTFIKNNIIINEGDPDKTRWTVLLLEGITHGAIKDGNGLEYAKISTDTQKKIIQFVFSNDPNQKHQLHYQKKGNQLLLTGKLYDYTLKISLTKMNFELIERKLNWINEHPYNR